MRILTSEGEEAISIVLDGASESGVAQRAADQLTADCRPAARRPADYWRDSATSGLT
jgi:hypothetical protein